MQPSALTIARPQAGLGARLCSSATFGGRSRLPPSLAALSKRCVSPRAGPSYGPTGSSDEPLPEQPLAGNSPILEVESQSERALAYGGIAWLLGAAGLALATAPGRAVEFMWAASPGPLVAGLARAVGAGLLLAAICAHCLKEAAEHDRLRSETYQRLNLALILWGLGSALPLWLAPHAPLRLALGVATALLGATAAHAALTYQETSERGLNPAYLTGRLYASLRDLASYRSTEKSAVPAMWAYGLGAAMAAATCAALLLEWRLGLLQAVLLRAPLGALGATLAPVAGAGYSLLAVVLYTLKDAAQRGRLGASTFKALNIGAAITALTSAGNLAAGMQAGHVTFGPVAGAKLAGCAALAVVALYNYLFAKK